ncbi:MAG: hypothetical protein ACTSRZ_16390 [Promethearchaeota archaeon]
MPDDSINIDLAKESFDHSGIKREPSKKIILSLGRYYIKKIIFKKVSGIWVPYILSGKIKSGIDKYRYEKARYMGEIREGDREGKSKHEINAKSSLYCPWWMDDIVEIIPLLEDIEFIFTKTKFCNVCGKRIYRSNKLRDRGSNLDLLFQNICKNHPVSSLCNKCWKKLFRRGMYKIYKIFEYNTKYNVLSKNIEKNDNFGNMNQKNLKISEEYLESDEMGDYVVIIGVVGAIKGNYELNRYKILILYSKGSELNHLIKRLGIILYAIIRIDSFASYNSIKYLIHFYYYVLNVLWSGKFSLSGRKCCNGGNCCNFDNTNSSRNINNQLTKLNLELNSAEICNVPSYFVIKVIKANFNGLGQLETLSDLPKLKLLELEIKHSSEANWNEFYNFLIGRDDNWRRYLGYSDKSQCIESIKNIDTNFNLADPNLNSKIDYMFLVIVNKLIEEFEVENKIEFILRIDKIVNLRDYYISNLFLYNSNSYIEDLKRGRVEFYELHNLNELVANCSQDSMAADSFMEESYMEEFSTDFFNIKFRILGWAGSFLIIEKLYLNNILIESILEREEFKGIIEPNKGEIENLDSDKLINLNNFRITYGDKYGKKMESNKHDIYIGKEEKKKLFVIRFKELEGRLIR